MRFSIDKVLASGGRLGIIKQGNVTVETPMCTLFTKGGSAPHLSLDMLDKVSSVPDIAVMSAGNLVDHHESIAAFGKGLGQFTAMTNKLIFSTLQDASLAVASGKNDKNGVAVWGKGGKTKLDMKLYMDMIESFRPDWFQALSDGDTDWESGKKRLNKSVNRTLDFLDTIVEKWQKSEILNKSSLIGVVEGGFDLDERVRSAKETAARPVHGFLIEGFEKGHSGKDLFGFEDFPGLLSKTFNCLPDDKLRIMETVWSPLQVVKAFKLGVDVFSSSYPHILTEKGQALVADYTLPPVSQAAKLEVEGSKPDSQPEGLSMDLHRKCFFEDFSPILQGCSCYACANFTRSYIHHLLNTSELLAYVLLIIHNFHQYFDFFDQLRKAAHDGKIDQLEDSLRQQADGGR